MQNPSNGSSPAVAGGSQVASTPSAPAAPRTIVDINTVRLRLNQLRTEMNLAQEQQSEIVHNMTRMGNAAQPGLQQQLTAVQQQIVSLESQITETQAQIGYAVNTHATTTAPDDYNYPVRESKNGLGDGAGVAIVFFVVVLGPLAFALARRILRRPAAALPAMNASFGEMPVRMERLEQAVDTVALEIERISESQRFLTKLMAERQPVANLPGVSQGQST